MCPSLESGQIRPVKPLGPAFKRFVATLSISWSTCNVPGRQRVTWKQDATLTKYLNMYHQLQDSQQGEARSASGVNW